MMVDNLEINIKDAIKILPKKEIRKKITKDNVIRNLELALDEKSKRLDTIVYKQEVDNDRLKKFFNGIVLKSYQANV